MDLDRLRTFLAVVEHQSFSRASAALGCTQSTVSFHIRSLEDELGATLLDRRRGQVKPTSAGQRLLPYARKLATLAAEARAHLRDEERGASGQIRVAASTVPGEQLLPALIARFRQGLPGVTFVVEISDSKRALAALLEEQCDLALVGARTTDKRLRFQAFADDEVVLVAAPDTPWARLKRPTPADLRDAPVCLREEGSGTRLATRALSVGRPVVEVGSSEALKRCALAGVGLAFVSRLAVADELAAGRLTQVPLAGTPIPRRFWAVTLAAVPQPAAVRSFLSMLAA
jgi:DNA-binding transcriptional LysR family regulator